MTLDENIEKQVADFLAPFFINQNARFPLVNTAIKGARSLRHIDWDDSSFIFANHLVSTILTWDGYKTLIRLLEAFKSDVGVDQHPDIDNLIFQIEEKVKETNLIPPGDVNALVAQKKAEQIAKIVEGSTAKIDEPQPVIQKVSLRADNQSQETVAVPIARHSDKSPANTDKKSPQIAEKEGGGRVTIIVALIGVAGVIIGGLISNYGMIALEEWKLNRQLTQEAQTAIARQQSVDMAQTEAAESVTAIWNSMLSQTVQPTHTSTATDSPIPTTHTPVPPTYTALPPSPTQFPTPEHVMTITATHAPVTPTATATNTRTNTPTPSLTPFDTLTPIAFPNGRLLQFFYNATSFYMRNDSNGVVRISRISFQGIDADGNAVSSVFAGSVWVSGYAFVEGNGRCAAIEMVDRLGHLEPNQCGASSIGGMFNAHKTPQSFSEEIFWTGRNQIQFTVYWDGIEIARCPIPDYTQENGFCEVRVGN